MLSTKKMSQKGMSMKIALCAGSGCVAAGSLAIEHELKKKVKEQGIDSQIEVTLTGCIGFCSRATVALLYPEGIFYQYLRLNDIPKIVEDHFINHKPVESLMYRDWESKKTIPLINDIPFYKNQVFRVLKNQGFINPEIIEDYISRDGYEATKKALTKMTPEQIIDVMKESKIRGRGGAGFPAGRKWESCAQAPGAEKFIVCNGDEGDLGAFMDRALLESDPHAVIEGLIIGARAINSHKGYIYVRAEYPLAVKRLYKALEQARQKGFLGKNILNTGFDFDIEIYQGSGAFVCGESSALMFSIEGKRPMPRPRPPQSTQMGLWEKPTVLNNVETLANVPLIILNGPEWYKEYGTEKSTGTKLFAMTGAVNNVGLVEVPMGMPLKKIIYDIGGGITKKRSFKAVQLGGPSGGCLPESCLDVHVDFDSLVPTGSIMGSGGLVVMDDSNCMVNVAKFFLQFTADESCGKCTPCRVGTRIMLDILNDICEGKGQEGDIENLLDLSQDIILSSLCGLGQSAPNPVLTTIRYFRDEYEAHIRNKWCKVGVCRELTSYSINPDLCTGCGACRRACPQNAIVGEKKEPHKIIEQLCIRCRGCYDTCKFNAVRIGPAKASKKKGGKSK
jgi:NADH:ubiquinone oxidoreductase subunit F (NADH-binding)/(2Fe-2S) ferredoxin